MRFEYATRLEAGTQATSIHDRLIAADPVYAQAVSLGQITAWAKPYQDVDAAGVPISSFWYVNCKERMRARLTPTEEAALKPYRSA